MLWEALAISLASKPRVPAGPILRKVTPLQLHIRFRERSRRDPGGRGEGSNGLRFDSLNDGT